ncbi:MAG: aerobic carbon-monoxide dehydrogenase medium subunit [Actinomycetota bacterium]|nr:aerobic carbon-monoxide dehydrogenase medium subunit [Actinomycetota bacterium]
MQVPAPFDYERATSVDHVLTLLAERPGDARIVAGGHSLLPMMKLRLAQPEMLIDINDLTDLDYIRVDGDEIAIGAMTRHAGLLSSALLGEHYRIFRDAERVIADPIVRNRGTIGGSLCQADPSEDLSAVASALRATVVIQSATGRRTVDARDFHQGPYETAVGDAEMLVEVRVPIRPGAGSAYEKVERRAGDWAVASAGAFVQLDGDTIKDVGLGLTAVGAPHFTCVEAEEALRGQAASAENVAAAAQLCHDACQPQADQRGPEDYKRHLARELSRRVLTTSIARARGEQS